MARVLDPDLVIKICRLYYNQGLSHTEISNRLRISRFRVARILKKAQQRGIVRISIAEPLHTVPELEEFLEKAFKLRHAIVVRNAGFSDQDVKQQIGAAAAGYLQEIVQDGDILGVSWGSTVNEVARALAPLQKRIQVVQVNGGSPSADIDVECHEITRRIAGKFNAACHLLYAPALVDSTSIRDAIMTDSSVRYISDLYDKLDIALLGIGTLHPEPSPTLVRPGNISDAEFKMLISQGMVGDIFYHFFDQEGVVHDYILGDRIIAMSLDQLKRVPYSIGVAGGYVKARAILGALRTGLLRIIVTDSAAAEVIRTLAAS